MEKLQQSKKDLLPFTKPTRPLKKAVVVLSGLILIFFTHASFLQNYSLPGHGHRRRLTLQEREAFYLLVTLLCVFQTCLFERSLLGLSQALKVPWKHLEHTQPTLILQAAQRTCWMPKQFFTFYRMNSASQNLFTSQYTMQDQPRLEMQLSSSPIPMLLLILQPGSILISRS